MDSKVQNRVLQLGSLNDELKRVVELTNTQNAKNAELLKKTEELESIIANFDLRKEDVKRKIVEAEFLYDNRLKDIEKLDKIEALKKQDIESLVKFIEKLESKINSIRESTKDAESVKKGLSDKRKELTGLEAKKSELDKLNSEVVKLKSEINKRSKALETLATETKEERNKISGEKAKHRSWLKDTSKKARDELQKARDSVATLLKTKRDLKVIERRLARKWKELYNTPFPKIYV